jgi:hypothetical protein
MLFWEGVVDQRLLDCLFHELGGSDQVQRAQLLDHSDSLLPRRHDIRAGMDRLEHRRDLSHLCRGNVAEDVAIPMHDRALPRRIREGLGRTLGKAQTGIRYDQPHAINIRLGKSSQNGSKPVTKSDPVSEVS